jgi:hypothetical protein
MAAIPAELAGAACLTPTAAAPAAGGGLRPVPVDSTVPPACPTTLVCPYGPAPPCSVTDIGPCCSTGGGTFCCNSGTIKVQTCNCATGSVLGRAFCFGPPRPGCNQVQWACG